MFSTVYGILYANFEFIYDSGRQSHTKPAATEKARIFVAVWVVTDRTISLNRGLTLQRRLPIRNKKSNQIYQCKRKKKKQKKKVYLPLTTWEAASKVHSPSLCWLHRKEKKKGKKTYIIANTVNSRNTK